MIRNPSLSTSIYASIILSIFIVLFVGFYSAWETYATGSPPLATVFLIPLVAGVFVAVEILPKDFYWLAFLTGMLFEVLFVLIVIHGIRYFRWYRSVKLNGHTD